MTMSVLAVYVALSVLAGILGRKRRIGFWGYVFCSLLISPCICLLLLILSTPRASPAPP